MEITNGPRDNFRKAEGGVDLKVGEYLEIIETIG